MAAHDPELEPGASELSEAELSALLRSASMGDSQAWRQILDLYGRRVFALAKSRLRRSDLAEEITQSVFVTVATKLRPEPALGGVASNTGYTEQGKFEAWLFRIAVNRIRDEVRKLRRHATPTDPEVLSDLGHTDRNTPGGKGVELQTQLAALRDAMERLSEADREIIELRHHAGMSFAQMAQLLGEPLGTLLARHHRALRKLKGALNPSEADPESE